MKKFYNLTVFYTVLALIGGVFYREFTKFNHFTGTTTLGFVHTHAFMLGMFFFLLLLLLEKQFHLSNHRHLQRFLGFYNAGLLITITMLIIRGIMQVKGISLSTASNAMISGFAGIGHILLGVGFIYFFIILKKQLHLNTK